MLVLSHKAPILQGFNNKRDSVDLDSWYKVRSERAQGPLLFTEGTNTVWSNHLSLRPLLQNKSRGSAEEAGRARVGRAAAETSGGLSDTEAEGGRAQGRWLWEDLRAGCRQRRSRLQGLPPTLWSDYGEEGKPWPRVGLKSSKAYFSVESSIFVNMKCGLVSTVSKRLRSR